MKQYFFKIIFFSIPFLLPLIFVLIIDPFNFINFSKLVDDDVKQMVMNGSDKSLTRGNMLWKVLKYKRNPCANIIIGDSDGYHIREQLVTELTGEEYFNFSISGATIETQISIFWYAAEKEKLKKVYFQITFELSNENQSYNLFYLAQDYLDKPYLYFLNKEILYDSFRNMISAISNKTEWVDHSYMTGSSGELKNKIESSANALLKNYAYPEKQVSELKKISDYCINQGIEFELIIFPVSNLNNGLIVKYDLIQMRERFYNEISSLGKTHSFLTSYLNYSDKNNFTDYSHTNQRVTDSMTVEIW